MKQPHIGEAAMLLKCNAEQKPTLPKLGSRKTCALQEPDAGEDFCAKGSKS